MNRQEASLFFRLRVVPFSPVPPKQMRLERTRSFICIRYCIPVSAQKKVM